MKPTIVIAGAGGIGQAAALILAENPALDCKIILGDISQRALKNSLNFVKEGTSNKDAQVATFEMPKSGYSDEMVQIFDDADVVLDCLPGSQAPRIAQLAKDKNLHYANLTEYVNETEQIMEISKGANTAFVLQTGLAPGFINVLACKLYEDFSSRYNVDKADRMEMKVGAISEHVSAPHFYAFTWSPIGVATEYMKDAHVVRDYKKIAVPALSGCETLIIDGITYEDNFTSGGAADLPEAFSGRIKDLDYKTIRYPGHYAWVKDQVANIPAGPDQINQLEAHMLENIPSVEDDVVVVFAAVQGKDDQGKLRRVEKSYTVRPSKIGNQTLRAIQSTTAAPLCEMAKMMLEKNWKGTVLQSQISTDEFLNGAFVKSIYGAY